MAASHRQKESLDVVYLGNTGAVVVGIGILPRQAGQVGVADMPVSGTKIRSHVVDALFMAGTGKVLGLSVDAAMRDGGIREPVPEQPSEAQPPVVDQRLNAGHEVVYFDDNPFAPERFGKPALSEEASR